MLATTVCSPRSLYVDHTWGALMRWMFHSMVLGRDAGLALTRTAWMTCPVQSGTTWATSGRAATADRVEALDVTRSPLMIRNDKYDAPRRVSNEATARWLEVATEVRRLYTYHPRAFQLEMEDAADRSACCRRSTQ